MQTLIKNFSLGSITYRMPNIVESMRIMGKLGGTDKSDATDQGRTLMFVSNLIENMKPFVTEIVAEKAGQPITDWETALEHMEFLKPLSEIASEIMAHFSPKAGAEDSKNS